MMKQTYPIDNALNWTLHKQTLHQALVDQAEEDLGVESHDGTITVKILDNNFVCVFVPNEETDMKGA